MRTYGLSCVFPCTDIRRTAEYYKSKLGVEAAEYLQSGQPHVCLYWDGVEIILTQALQGDVKPNRLLYGYGYDAYIYVDGQRALQEEFQKAGVKIAVPLAQTDYGNSEFVIEDIDGRWLAFGLKNKESFT